MVEKSLLVRLLMYLTRVGERIRRVRNLTPRASSSPSTLWVVSFWSMTSRCGSWPLTVFQWSQNALTSRAWVVLGQPVGVAGKRRLLWQGPKPGEQAGGRVWQQVVDVGHPPGPGELERQQRQQPGCSGDDAGAGVAGLADQVGQVQGGQVGDDQQQPGPGGVQPMGPGGQVQHRGPGQASVAAC